MTTDNTLFTTLESAANQIFAAVAPNTYRLVRIGVEIREDASTASTDGALTIRMPTRFCDITVAQDAKVAVGLLVHEVGHFLQPLDEVDQVEEEQRIPHWLTNVALDVQAESLLQVLFPSFRSALTEVRQAVGRAHLAEYEAAIRRAMTFAQAAGSLALWGRFARPITPFCNQRLPEGTPESQRSAAFMYTMHTFRTCPTRKLPQALARLIHNFPELRNSPAPAYPLKGTAARQATDAIGSALKREARDQASGLAGGGEGHDIQRHRESAQPPLTEAVFLARTLRTHFCTRKGGIQILAPGRLARRAAIRDEVPFRMCLPGRDASGPGLVLCLDASGSMSGVHPGSAGGSKWQIAQIAAQAVALAVQAEGGHVVGLVFADDAWTTVRGDAGALLLPLTIQRRRVGTGTSFRFLSELWRAYPDRRVLVVTDGVGDVPTACLSFDRDRTAAVIIPPGDATQAVAWSSRQVILSDLRRLANVLTLLTPRGKNG